LAATTLGLETVIRQAPSFSGGTDSQLSIFITKCEFLFSNVTDTIKPQLLRAIITNIEGNVHEYIKYHEFETWDQLKNHLKTIYQTSHSINYLQKQLTSMKQRHDESIQDFSNRIQQIYHQLTSALTIGKTVTESRTIAESMLTTTLVVFMEGINPSIRLILEARNISSYEETVRIATEKENVCRKNYNQKNNRPFNNNQRTSN